MEKRNKKSSKKKTKLIDKIKTMAVISISAFNVASSDSRSIYTYWLEEF